MKLIKTFIYLSLLFLDCIYSFNCHIFNFNTIIRKSIDDSIINFIKVNNVKYLKLKESSKYLILKYEDSPIAKKEEEPKNTYDFMPIIIKSNDIENTTLKVANTNKYVILVSADNDYYYKIYDIIKNNMKPILILYDKKIENTTYKYKYAYLIKDKNNYLFKYNYLYNNIYHKYLFDIHATEINKYETNWNVTAIFNYNLKEIIDFSKISIINWFINNSINNNNNKNYFYKKYLLFQYLTNNTNVI